MAGRRSSLAAISEQETTHLQWWGLPEGLLGYGGAYWAGSVMSRVALQLAAGAGRGVRPRTDGWCLSRGPRTFRTAVSCQGWPRRMGCRGAWRFLAPPWRAAPGTATGWVPVGGRLRVSKPASGMGRSNPTALWVIDRDKATAWSAWMRPSLRAAVATRVWHRLALVRQLAADRHLQQGAGQVMRAQPAASPARLVTPPGEAGPVRSVRRCWGRPSAPHTRRFRCLCYAGS